MASPDVMDRISRDISPNVESTEVFQTLAKKLHRLESRLGKNSRVRDTSYWSNPHTR